MKSHKVCPWYDFYYFKERRWTRDAQINMKNREEEKFPQIEI